MSLALPLFLVSALVPSSTARQAALHAVAELMDAGLKRDVARLEKLYPQSYFHTNADGSVMRRSEVLALYRRPLEYPPDSQVRDDDLVEFAGRDTAVVSSRVSIKGHVGESAWERLYRITWTLARLHGRWRVVNSHASLFPAEGPAAAGGSTVVGRVSGVFSALSVADVAAASRWYQDILGFRLLASGEAPDGTARGVVLEGDGNILELVQRREARPRGLLAPSATDDAEVHGIFKLGMVVGDLDRLYAELQKRAVAVEFGIVKAKDVPMRTFAVRDAERNMIQFFGK
jgi:catechol 2,3-dioxygenase-like lactoylglutathione lyase family enzyme